MAKNNTPEKGAPKSKAKLFTMVSLAFVAGAHLAALVVTMAAFHLSLFGMYISLYSGGLLAAGLMIAFSFLAVLGFLKAAGARNAEQTARIETVKTEIEAMLKENNTKFSSSVCEIEKKIDQFLGENYARLEKENEKMRAELDDLQKTGMEDVNSENATLRLENSNLQEMITQWAINSVDGKVKQPSLEVA